MPGFTHLHTVSGFSLRYGASHPERLAERASERGMDALALTDRDTLAGAVRFSKACGKAGVRPLFGADLAVAGVEPLAERRRRTPVRGGAFVDESAPRVTFLARDGARGWGELCRLVSAAHEGEGPPLLPWGRNHAEGLTVLLGPASDVGRALAAGRPDRAARLLVPWRDVYGDDLRLEAVWHGREGTGPGSLRLAARTVGFAAEQRVRPVLTNAVRYADPGLGPVADVLDAARRLVPIDPAKGLDSGAAWLKGAGDMVGVAERIVEAAGFRRETAHRLVEQTEATAAECLVDPEDDLGIGTVHFPEPHLVGAGRRTAQRTLASRAAAGMVLRGYDRRREYWERMHHELDIIAHHGFASYFLTVSQVVEDVRKMGVRVAARGSGAGSLVNHLLGIAHADPIEHRLLMERFLSKERVVLPDIDIDVESARRLEVYRAIIDRFGTERVATVAMPETYRVRHAIRDVGAALSMDPAEIDRVAKSFPHIRARDARAALEELPELRALAGEKEKYGRLWELVEALDALPRGVAMHPCGVLLSDALPAGAYAGHADQWRGLSDGAVRQGRRRGPRAAEARCAGCADAVGHGARGGGSGAGVGGEGGSGCPAAGGSGDVPAGPVHRDARVLPDRVARSAGSGRAAPAGHVPRPRRRHLAVPARAGRRRHGAAVHRGAARAGADPLSAP
ncbi:DNA polymerase III alpha subunit [Streptomyces luteogriseus]|nr:DNA polymerase III alpha subunit [Streptomyces luteogriseus]